MYVVFAFYLSFDKKKKKDGEGIYNVENIDSMK